jgi:hypothetical protein
MDAPRFLADIEITATGEGGRGPMIIDPIRERRFMKSSPGAAGLTAASSLAA